MPVAQKLCCQVERIIDHGSQVYSLELIPERPVPRFLPGQFMHLAIDVYDPGGFWPESRVFSIASSPEIRQKLRITYSVRGKYTARMAQELKIGSQLWIKLPYGDFVIRDSADVVLLGGGTGITAFTAFLEGLNANFSHHVYLFYGARTRELLIYRQMVKEIADRVPALSYWCFIENGEVQSLNETIGRLSIDEVIQKVKSPLNANYYLSGPPEMLKSFSNALVMRQVHLDQIFQDAWE
jgi:ferredoxin-NADP reductase